jgi:hypothetical protein
VDLNFIRLAGWKYGRLRRAGIPRFWREAKPLQMRHYRGWLVLVLGRDQR